MIISKRICSKLFLLLWTLIMVSCSKPKLIPYGSRIIDVPDWPMSGGTPQRTSYYPLSLEPPLELVWVEESSSAVGETIIYFGTLDGELNALAVSDGRRLSSKRFRYPPTPAYANGNLIIALRFGENTLFNINPGPGLQLSTIRWYQDAGDIQSEPLITPDGIVITSLDNHIDLYSFENRVKLWTFTTDDQIHSSPTFANGAIIFGCDDGHVYSIDQTDGTLNWKVNAGASVQSTASYSVDLEMVFIGSSDNSLYALDIDTGHIIWKYETAGPLLNGIATDERHVIFGSTDRHLYCLDAASGEKRWTFKAKSVISTNPIIAVDKVIFGSLDHFLYILDIADGTMLWNTELKGRIRTSPVIWSNLLICASEDNHVYMFRESQKNN